MDFQHLPIDSSYVAAIIISTLGLLAIAFRFRHILNARSAYVCFAMLLGLVLVFIPDQGVFENQIGHLTHVQNQTIATLSLQKICLALGGLLCFSAFLVLVMSTFPSHAKTLAIKIQQQKELTQKYRQIKDDTDYQRQNIEHLNTEIDTLIQQQYSKEKNDSNNITLYRTIFDKSSLFYIALSDEYRITDINKFACLKLNYGFGDIVNYRFLDLVQPSDRQRVQALLEAIPSSASSIPKFDTILRDQNSNPISVVVEPHIIEKKGKPTVYLFCQDVSESKKLSDELSYQALHDDLTQLMNRRALQAYFEEHYATPEAMSRVNLIYIDMDQFKVVNDTCGHTAGDQLLKQIASLLGGICNENHVSVFARIGGDEFAIALSDMNPEQSKFVAEALRNAIEDFTFVWGNKSFRQSISVGLAISDSNSRTFNELLSAADAACYSAKEHGRNQVKQVNIGDNDTNFDQRGGMLWVSRIDNATRDAKDGNFSLNFQPIIKLNQPYASYIHYEVLLQYTDENGNIIPPGNFIPSAERFGKATDLDMLVLTETLYFLRNNPEHTRHLDCCSINLTSHSIANERSRSAIISMAERHDFPRSKICFEITETNAISNLPEAIEFITKLRSLGCRFALDDFGTGFSSFGYLKNLDVDYLKIDGSFVRDIVDDKIDKVMIAAISEIAKEMGIKTVAEYVENEQILRELKKVNVDLGQGFGIAKPMPLEAVHDFYHYGAKPMSL